MSILNTIFSTQGKPSSELHIDKDQDNYGIGEGLAFHADADDNIAIGENALNSTSGDANQNIGIGTNALTAISVGDSNVAVGHNALAAATQCGINVAIGLSAAAAFSTLENDNIAIGQLAMGSMDEGSSGNVDNNIAIGSSALLGKDLAGASVDILNNIAIGKFAMDSTSIAAQNGAIAIGYAALGALTSGQDNIAIGYQAMLEHTTGGNNLAIGYQAMDDTGHGACPTSVDNVFIGKQSGGGTWANNDSNYNVGVGNYTLDGLMDGAESNVAIGHEAGSAITTADDSVFVGKEAGENVTIADGCVAIGKNAFGGVTVEAANYCVAIGHSAIQGTSATNQAGTVGIGFNALSSLSTGAGNTALGYQAGNVLTTGAENTIIGYDCDVASDDNTNNIIIGNNLTGTDKDNAVFIGNNTNHIENDFNTDATWTYSSDIRQKTAIEDDKLGLGFINKLRTVTYKHKSPSEFPAEWTAYDADDKKPMGGDKIIHGMIAQEVKAALDKSDIDTFGGWSVGDDGRQRISLEKMVLPLIKAVQELSAEVEELKNK